MSRNTNLSIRAGTPRVGTRIYSLIGPHRSGCNDRFSRTPFTLPQSTGALHLLVKWTTVCVPDDEHQNSMGLWKRKERWPLDVTSHRHAVFVRASRALQIDWTVTSFRTTMSLTTLPRRSRMSLVLRTLGGHDTVRSPCSSAGCIFTLTGTRRRLFSRLHLTGLISGRSGFLPWRMESILSYSWRTACKFNLKCFRYVWILEHFSVTRTAGSSVHRQEESFYLHIVFLTGSPGVSKW